MWLSTSSRLDYSNAVRAVVRYCSAPKTNHGKIALDILKYIQGTSEYDIAYQRATLASVALEVFADADYASRASERLLVSRGAIIMC